MFRNSKTPFGSRPTINSSNSNKNNTSNDGTASSIRNRAQQQSRKASTLHMRNSEAAIKIESNKLDLSKISQLLRKQPSDALIGLCNSQFDYQKHLSASAFSKPLIEPFAQLISLALKTNAMYLQRKQIANKLLESQFLQKHVYSALLETSSIGEYKVSLIKVVINLMSQVIDLCPKSSHLVEGIKERLELIIKNRMKNNKELIEEYDKKLSKVDTIAQMNKDRRIFLNENSHLLTPPNDIAEINIIPALEDIVNDEDPFLRRNITNGAYQSVEHYLDVQFRLLREDFLQPLRNGVLEVRKKAKEMGLKNMSQSLNKTQMRSLNDIDSVRIYHNVRVTARELTKNTGLAYGLKLDIQQNKINWEFTKRFMFGSLICISSDYFLNDCIIGTICELDKEKLKNNIILVNFNLNDQYIGSNELQIDANTLEIKNINKIPKFNQSYILIESTAYFEPYKHVLESFVFFKKAGEEAFPFREHLIYANNQNIEMPEYLKNVKIDLRFDAIKN
jgi:hypothetical protein